MRNIRFMQKGGRNIESANGGDGGDPKLKPRWGTRLGRIVGAIGVAGMGFFPIGCNTRGDHPEGKDTQSDASRELYNSAVEMGRLSGKREALRGRIERDRKRIDKLETLLGRTKKTGEIQLLKGRISALRNGITEMNTEMGKVDTSTRVRVDKSQAKREALLRRLDQEYE